MIEVQNHHLLTHFEPGVSTFVFLMKMITFVGRFWHTKPRGMLPVPKIFKPIVFESSLENKLSGQAVRPLRSFRYYPLTGPVGGPINVHRFTRSAES
jgi:hypothetical protein